MSIKRLLLVLVLFPFVLLSCNAGNGMRIGANVRLCCPGHYDQYQQYSLVAPDMPVFLRDYVVLEFDLAMREKGLTRNEGEKQLNIVLSYNHVNLAPEQEDIDPFVRTSAVSTELYYMAVIEVEMYEEATGELVWAGSISRIHHVTPGEYMHADRARPEFQSAFSRLLEAYPGRQT